MMGVLEFGFLYNNILTVQYAARQGVSAAAQAGGVDGADCSILKAVEQALTAPIDKSRVDVGRDLQVRRERATRSPARSTTTSGPARSTARARDRAVHARRRRGLPAGDRHDSLAEGLDVVGVRIGYHYAGITPIGSGRTWAGVGRGDAAHGAEAVSGAAARPGACRQPAARRSSSSPSSCRSS